MYVRINRRHTTRRLPAGFTLLELMTVLLIIGLLMSVAAFAFLGQGDTARRKTTVQSMKVIDTALKSYRLNSGTFPPTLDALVPKYLEKKPVDAWKRDFVYFVNTADSGKTFTLFSTGSSGTQGDPDNLDFKDADKILSE